ncbi:hypothetical protein ALQ16_202306 [Pseudomonas syringae pv. actinidiae]|nr:hypothetical protein ALQ16_202306 [Pseudomonas syringae pv. actinidiae]
MVAAEDLSVVDDLAVTLQIEGVPVIEFFRVMVEQRHHNFCVRTQILFQLLAFVQLLGQVRKLCRCEHLVRVGHLNVLIKAQREAEMLF